MLRSAAIKFAQGSTKGWVDELGGLVGRAVNPEPIKIPEAPEGPGSYEMTRDAMRREQDAAQKAHPWTSTIAQGAGELASDYLASKAGAPIGSLPYQVASGALSGAGNSAEETAGGVAMDAGAGGALAGVAGGALKYVAAPLAMPLGTALKRGLQNFAAERAIKATGAIQGNIRGIPLDRLRQMGGQLLDQDIIPRLGDKEVIRERAGEGLERVGSVIGASLEKADQQAASTGLGAFDWTPVLQRIKSEVWDQLGETGRRVAAGPLGFAMDAVESAKRGEGYAAANRLKSEIQGSINWATEPKLTSGVAKQIQGILNDEVENQVEARLGGQVADEFKAAKSLYGAFKTAEKGSVKGLERQVGNRILQPSDLGVGLAEAAGSGGGVSAFPKAAAIAAAHKLARERGSAVAAHAARGVAQSDALRRFIRSSPEAFGRFAAPLSNALQQGGSALAVTDFSLSQSSPEYRMRRKAALEQEGEIE